MKRPTMLIHSQTETYQYHTEHGRTRKIPRFHAIHLYRHYCVPIKEILREPPMSRLKSRRPFVIEAARLANLNQTEQETWEQSWIQGVPPGHNLVTDPTCPQPGFTLPRRQFVTLNRLRCGQARCAESLHRWGVIASPACPCGESHQTTRHIVEECLLTAFPGGLQRLHQAGPDAVEWLSRLSLKL